VLEVRIQKIDLGVPYATNASLDRRFSAGGLSLLTLEGYPTGRQACRCTRKSRCSKSATRMRGKAMETSLVGTFQFVMRKDKHLTWPRGE